MKKNDRDQLDARILVNEPAKLIDGLGHETACVLLDVSRDGFRARVEEATVPINLCRLVTKHEDLPIEVRWSTGLEIGGQILPEEPQS